MNSKIISPLSFDLEKRFHFILDQKHQKFDPCYIIASTLDPNYAPLIDEQDRLHAITCLVSMVLFFK